MPLGRFLKILLSGLLALAALFVVTVEFSLIQSDGDANNYAAYEQAAKEAYKYVCAFGIGIIRWFEARSHDFWLALLTGIIAVFTGCLWWSTRGLWDVTRQTVDNLVATERARFFIVVSGNNLGLNTEFYCEGRPDTLNEHSKWRVSYFLKNYGKTPAIIRETSHFLINAAKPPDEPTYFPVDIVEGEFAISTDKSTKERTCFLDPSCRIGQREAINIFKGETSLWFYGRVLYDDVLGGKEHEHCWLWRYNGNTKGFRPCYDYPNYIKNT